MGEIKWKKETSAGGVVYKRESNSVFILLIEPKGPNFGPPVGFWTFPKGLIDEGEDVKVAAIREVREEGGVNAEIEQELGYIKYFRRSEAFGNAIKFVHFYLMQYIDGNPEEHDAEIASADWFAVEEVESKLKFSHDKDIFKKAYARLIG
jgi:8-oxo-dGTP diphosphatase